MQILKDEIRERMLGAALDEFLERGFSGASMRSIAKRAFISVSNLYNYFTSKDDLFRALADPAYRRFEGFIDEFMASQPVPDFDDPGSPGRAGRRLLDEIGCFFISYRNEMLLLMDKSRGTRYDKVKTAVIQLLENYLLEAVEEEPASGKDKNDGKRFIIHIVAANVLEGILKILRYGKNEQWMKDVMGLFISYHMRDSSFLMN